MQLDEIKIGWKSLAKILNRVRSAINSNDPVQGYGISISKTPSGSVIAVDPKTSDDTTATTAVGSGGIQGVLQQVTVFDATGNPITLNVWTDGTVYAGPGWAWQSVDLVDPSTCVSTTIKVLTMPS